VTHIVDFYRAFQLVLRPVIEHPPHLVSRRVPYNIIEILGMVVKWLMIDAVFFHFFIAGVFIVIWHTSKTD